MSNENKPLETGLPSRNKGANRTMFRDTLSRALLADDAKMLRALCDELGYMALDKGLTPSERLSAIKLIMERVDGKPAQSVEVIDSSERPSSGLFKIVKIEGQ
jgi:hypothetical protein